MKVVINAGHTIAGSGTGANGYINESKENREVTKLVIKMLKQLGHSVVDCTVDKSENYLKDAVSIANKHKADLAVSIHFNAGGGTGVETLVYDDHDIPNKYAKSVNKEISSLGYKNRGIKKRPDLYWLRATTSKAILIECCFVDSKEDTSKYSAKKMAEAITNGIAGKVLSDNVVDEESNLYAVCVGAYMRKNADIILDEVKSKGYKDAYLIKR
ncbi:MAG: N-acetylmuramoyl-L-alanine amidase [Peptostreptococcaceae bacterium]